MSDSARLRISWRLALLALAAVSLAAYLAVAWLSQRFVYGQGHLQRPIPLVLGLFGVAFAAYVVALALAVRREWSRWSLVGYIVAPAVAFRLALLFSTPIQEIDIYRYVWDGEAVAAGVSPFRYSPHQVLAADRGEPLPEGLRRLAAKRDREPALETILQRIHFGDLPTVYPPVSQAVFAAGAALTPRDASLETRVVVLKSLFVGFDLGTLGLVLALLRATGRNLGWSLAYGWCPLAMKEFANSGHLDAIAVFLTTLALLLAVRALSAKGERLVSRGQGRLLACLSGVALGLACGAKIYPIVLAPLLGWLFLRHFGAKALAPTFAFTVVAAVALWPMAPGSHAGPKTSSFGDSPVGQEKAWAPQDPSRGLATFLAGWEMNDLLFMILVENLKPAGDVVPWFVVTSEGWRWETTMKLAWRTGLPSESLPFLLARLVTTLIFVLLAGCLAYRAAKSQRPGDLLAAAFLTLAWFWLLSPTQNPWYWTWALPLVAFARNPLWLAMGGLPLVYYLRFWLSYHWPTAPALGTVYSGAHFFDFVVTWLEFAPWLLCLAWAAASTGRKTASMRSLRSRLRRGGLFG